MNLTALTYVALALISVLGIAEIWAGGEVGWWRYGAALLVLGLAYEWTLARFATVDTRLVGSGDLALGRRTRLEFELFNPETRPQNIRFVPDLPVSLGTAEHVRDVMLAPQVIVGQSVWVQPTELGEHLWSGLPAQVRGRLGLGWWRANVPVAAQLRVVPDTAGARGRVLGEMTRGAQARSPGVGYELHHLREYVRGDPLHTIDWKATARAQQPITRVFAEDQHLQIVLVLDVGRTSRTEIDGLSQFGHYVNVAARFAEHAVMQGDEIGLVVAAEQVVSSHAPARGAQAVRTLRHQLTGIAPRSVETDLLGAALHVHQMLKQRALVVLLTDMYGQSFTGSFGDALRLWRQKHLPLVVGMMGEDIGALSRIKAFEREDVYVSLASRRYREALAHNAEGAQRLGAHALVCRPAVLEERVFATYQMLKAQRRI